MSGKPTHPFHLVNPSAWPLLCSLGVVVAMLGGAMAMHAKAGGTLLLLVGMSVVFYVSFAWWRDVVREAELDKAHTDKVRHGLRWGMVLFIVSEVMFFAAFFWAFFNASTLPLVSMDEPWAMAEGIWPPEGIIAFDPLDLPLLNTLILLLSGTTVTWAHAAIFMKERQQAITALWLTVGLGVLFSGLQAYEYSHAAFGLTDGIYASTFYLATGFHGFHVIIGTIFLAVCLARLYKGSFTPKQHLGFEFAAWYWHFVDVVWLFLFLFVYGDFANRLMPVFETVFTGLNILIVSILAMVYGSYKAYKFVASGGLSSASH